MNWISVSAEITRFSRSNFTRETHGSPRSAAASEGRGTRPQALAETRRALADNLEIGGREGLAHVDGRLEEEVDETRHVVHDKKPYDGMNREKNKEISKMIKSAQQAFSWTASSHKEMKTRLRPTKLSSDLTWICFQGWMFRVEMTSLLKHLFLSKTH
jgi:hypothetical protein